ncbi:hypothetical protein N7453_011056 [Penicillium expansum]|nr:hypothetical protein N7453_011056 [Penicillium expansum]
MDLQNGCLQDIDPSATNIKREISRSEASTIYEIQLYCRTYAMKLFHDNGDPGYTKKGRDLNRLRCELNAYQKLHEFGVCDRGFVPAFYGFIDRLGPLAFHPTFQHISNDRFQPRAILLEYLPSAERLNCVNYSEDLFHYAVEGIKEIHDALVHHHDIYPKNMLVVSGKRIVWIDYDVATTFSKMGPREKAYCEYETELVKSFGNLLNADQAEGLAPNTKYY